MCTSVKNIDMVWTVLADPGLQSESLDATGIDARMMMVWMVWLIQLSDN